MKTYLIQLTEQLSPNIHVSTHDGYLLISGSIDKYGDLCIEDTEDNRIHNKNGNPCYCLFKHEFTVLMEK